MSTSQIKTAANVYRLVERLKSEYRKNGATELFVQLDDTLRLGSSGLEILGAVRQAIINNRASIERLLGAAGNDEADQVIMFVDKAFGR